MNPIDNLTFGQALVLLKEGAKVARQGWNGKGMFLFLVQGSTFKVNRPPLLGIYEEGTEINYQSHIDMKTADDTIVPWLCSQSDMLAEDWEVVGEIPKVAPPLPPITKLEIVVHEDPAHMFQPVIKAHVTTADGVEETLEYLKSEHSFVSANELNLVTNQLIGAPLIYLTEYLDQKGQKL